MESLVSIYFSPITRINVILMGMITGYYISQNNKKKCIGKVGGHNSFTLRLYYSCEQYFSFSIDMACMLAMC